MYVTTIQHPSVWYQSQTGMIDALRGERNGPPPACTTRVGSRADTNASWVFQARVIGSEVIRQEQPRSGKDGEFAFSWRAFPEDCVGSLIIADTVICDGYFGEAYLTGQDIPEGLAIGLGVTALSRLQVISYRTATRIPHGMLPDYAALEALFAAPHPADVAGILAAASQNHNALDELAMVN